MKPILGSSLHQANHMPYKLTYKKDLLARDAALALRVPHFACDDYCILQIIIVVVKIIDYCVPVVPVHVLRSRPEYSYLP